jgi:Zinc knuckle
MATTTGVQNFIRPPETFQRNGDLDNFILELKRFFELTQQPPEFQETLTKAFLSVELVTQYEETQSTTEGFEDRLRKAFEPKKNLAVDLEAALRFRKSDENCSQFFEKIEKLVDNILRHKLTKPALMLFLTQHAIEDRETKKELKMRDVKSLDKAKEVISRMEEIKKELESEQSLAAVHVKKTYADCARKPRQETDFRRQTMQSASNVNQLPHFRRFPNYERNPGPVRVRRCWACREEGHIRAECPSIRCNKCNKSGHFKYQCWSNRKSFDDRQGYFKQRYGNRNLSQDNGGRYKDHPTRDHDEDKRRHMNSINMFEDDRTVQMEEEAQSNDRDLKGEAPAYREALGAINLG